AEDITNELSLHSPDPRNGLPTNSLDRLGDQVGYGSPRLPATLIRNKRPFDGRSRTALGRSEKSFLLTSTINSNLFCHSLGTLAFCIGRQSVSIPLGNGNPVSTPFVRQ